MTLERGSGWDWAGTSPERDRGKVNRHKPQFKSRHRALRVPEALPELSIPDPLVLQRI